MILFTFKLILNFANVNYTYILRIKQNSSLEHMITNLEIYFFALWTYLLSASHLEFKKDSSTLLGH